MHCLISIRSWHRRICSKVRKGEPANQISIQHALTLRRETLLGTLSKIQSRGHFRFSHRLLFHSCVYWDFCSQPPHFWAKTFPSFIRPALRPHWKRAVCVVTLLCAVSPWHGSWSFESLCVERQQSKPAETMHGRCGQCHKKRSSLCLAQDRPTPPHPETRRHTDHQEGRGREKKTANNVSE